VDHFWLSQNNRNFNYQMFQQKINCCANTIFIYPVTENEVERVVKHLKGKFLAGFDEIPENLVKQCIRHIKKPLTHICNASFESSIFPDRLKIAKVKPLSKKEDIHDVQDYRPVSILLVFQNTLYRINKFPPAGK
jgi:hypothetical protein